MYRSKVWRTSPSMSGPKEFQARHLDRRRPADLLQHPMNEATRRDPLGALVEGIEDDPPRRTQTDDQLGCRHILRLCDRSFNEELRPGLSGLGPAYRPTTFSCV